MNFNQLNGFVYDKESKEIGAIAGIDFLKQTLTILTDDEDKVVAKISNIVFLEEVGVIGEVGVINHDVLSTVDGKMYEVDLQKDGNTVQIHLLNDKLERVAVGEEFDKEDIGQLEPYVVVLGNIFEMEEELPTVDFNIRVVREVSNGEVTYFYACNNAEQEEVDLIKVVFIGHQLLEEETYERRTISHDVYLDSVDAGTIKEINPQELLNYVTGLTYGKTITEPVINDFKFEEEIKNKEDKEEDNDEDYCNDCGESLEECDCEW